jgi:hypothetical protein
VEAETLGELGRVVDTLAEDERTTRSELALDNELTVDVPLTLADEVVLSELANTRDDIVPGVGGAPGSCGEENALDDEVEGVTPFECDTTPDVTGAEVTGVDGVPATVLVKSGGFVKKENDTDAGKLGIGVDEKDGMPPATEEWIETDGDGGVKDGPPPTPEDLVVPGIKDGIPPATDDINPGGGGGAGPVLFANECR